jgi:hypothetical protein
LSVVKVMTFKELTEFARALDESEVDEEWQKQMNLITKQI